MLTLRAWSACALVICFALAFARQAEAAPSARLVYGRAPGAETCPGESELRRDVADRLGYDPFFPYAKMTIIAEIEALPHQGFRARLQVMDDEGHLLGVRELRSPRRDCAEIVRALALDLSIAVDDLAMEAAHAPAADSHEQEALPSPPPPPPSPPPQPVIAAPAQDDVVANARDDTAPRLEAGLGVLTSLGTAPRAAPGGAVYVGLRWRTLTLAAEARADLPATGELAGGGSVRSSLALGSLLACVHGRIPFACATGSIGALTGGGEGIATPRSGSAPFAATGARVGAELPIAWNLFARAQIDAAYVPARATIRIDGEGAFTVSPVALSFGIAAVVRF